MKKALNYFRILLVMLTIFLGLQFTISAKTVTEDEVFKNLHAIKQNTFPVGSAYNRSFDGGTECYGFAKNVVYLLFGKYSGTNDYRTWLYNGESAGSMNMIGSITDFSAEKMKALLSKAKPGDVLQFDVPTQHSMIVYSITADNFTVYDANMDGHNGIELRTNGYGDYQKWNSKKLSLLRSENYDITEVIIGNCAENYKMTLEGTLNCRLGPGTNYPLVRDGYGVGTGEQLIIVRKETSGDGKTWGYGRGFNHALQTYLEGWYCLDGFTEHQFSYIPEAPALSYEITAQDSAHITWNPVPNATSYAVYVNGQKAQVTTSTSYDVSSNGESEITVKVEAINSDFYYADIYPCTNISGETVLDFSSSDIEISMGDLDSDGIKTIDDVIYLFWSIFDSVNYPVSVNTDYDRDGVNTIDDVIYLFWSIFDLVNYPL